MKHDILAFMNLYEIFGYIQEQAWGSLPQAGSKQVSALNSRQIKAMMIVYMRSAGGKDALSLNRLAGFLNMKKAAASLLVSDLADKKLVCRTVDPENRRFIRITLAPKGQRLGDAITAQAAAHVAGLLQNLTAEERRNLTAAADKIYACYSREVEGEK